MIPYRIVHNNLTYIKSINLIIPLANLSACYNIDTKYLVITYDETKVVEILEQQFITCHQPNRQFCSITTPLQPLSNPPSCISATYAKNKAGIEKGCDLQMRNTNSTTIPTSIPPNVWMLASAPTAVSTGIMLIFTYHQHVALHLNTSIYHPIMKLIS